MQPINMATRMSWEKGQLYNNIFTQYPDETNKILGLWADDPYEIYTLPLKGIRKELYLHTT